MRHTSLCLSFLTHTYKHTYIRTRYIYTYTYTYAQIRIYTYIKQRQETIVDSRREMVGMTKVVRVVLGGSGDESGGGQKVPLGSPWRANRNCQTKLLTSTNVTNNADNLDVYTYIRKVPSSTQRSLSHDCFPSISNRHDHNNKLSSLFLIITIDVIKRIIIT